MTPPMSLLMLNVLLGVGLALAARHEHRAGNHRVARLLGTVAIGAAAVTTAVAWTG